MLGEKHDLIHELPEYQDKIHELKTSNQHFARLFDEYHEVEHEVEHEVRHIEEEFETPSDEYVEERKKLRLNLKDQLLEILKKS